MANIFNNKNAAIPLHREESRTRRKGQTANQGQLGNIFMNQNLHQPTFCMLKFVLGTALGLIPPYVEKHVRGPLWYGQILQDNKSLWLVNQII